MRTSFLLGITLLSVVTLAGSAPVHAQKSKKKKARHTQQAAKPARDTVVVNTTVNVINVDSHAAIVADTQPLSVMKFLIHASPEYATVVKAINAVDLAETFEHSGNYTMFVPINKAFDILPAGTVDRWLKPENNPELKGVLTYHIVAGNISIPGFLERIKTAGGEYVMPTIGGTGKLTFSSEGNNIMVKDERGMKVNIGNPVKTSNGTVYSIDHILLPGKI